MKRDEEALQRAVCGLLAIYEAKRLLCFAHIPSGGYRTPAEAAILKAMGVKRGIPDLLVWTGSGHSFGIELKGPKGSLSDAQILWKSTLESLGHRVYVCWSVEEVELALRIEGVPPIGVLTPEIRSPDAVKPSGAIRKPSKAETHQAPLAEPGKGIACTG